MQLTCMLCEVPCKVADNEVRMIMEEVNICHFVCIGSSGLVRAVSAKVDT